MGKRKYNLASCLVLSAIGAFFGALAVSGLIFPFTAYVLSLLPHGDLGIPAEVFTVICRGGLIAVPVALVIVWIVRSRSPVRQKRQNEQRARLDALLERDEESGTKPPDS